MKKKGFTLVELIVVIAILAVLMMLIVPQITGYLQKAKEQTAKSNARVVVQTVQIEYADQYILGNLMNKVSLPSTDILNRIYDYSNAKGTVNSITADTRNDIEHLVYQEGDIFVTYCRDYYTHSAHDALYNITDHVNSMSSIWLDTEDGTKMEFSVSGNMRDINRPVGSMQGEIFYYDGDAMEHGYYIVRTPHQYLYNYANIEKILKETWGPGYFAKIDLDATVKTYRYDPNKAVKKGEIYLINFEWDDNPDPVLAMVSHWETGTDANNWRGDLTLKTDDLTNQTMWTILAEQK